METRYIELFLLTVSLPNLEVIKLTELENLERLEHGSLSVGSLSKLKEFSVSGCGKLLCVFASQLLPMLRDLETLAVESCNLLEVVFELEGADSSEPNPKILSPLKSVALWFLPKLNYISKRDPMGFKYIQTLNIFCCNSLRYVFAPTMTKSIPQLRNLRIGRCEMLSRIVAEENGLGESSVDEVEFPQLKSLVLTGVPNLVSFFPNVNTTSAKSSDYYHNPVQPQPLFNEKVGIPSLEYLRLSGLENVRNVFNPSMAGGLVNLQNLSIDDCSTLEVVVGKEEEVGHGRKIDKTLFPQLIKLQLGSLLKLKRFCHFTQPLEIPLLRAMGIADCPSMDAFSLGHVSVPNLSLPGISWNGDLNNAIQSLQKRKVVIEVAMETPKSRFKVFESVCLVPGVESIAWRQDLEVIGHEIDAVALTIAVRKNVGPCRLVFEGPVQ
ncbi:hypothetical protein Vadar_006917 [Vaccinium darrowii]|uniref:Uncharacterized protein n=1 Tax=Vaccinium darrowii TaxID=229202 RepID=A0ACB7YKB4_9ERIC|nr:hypothetical protein Vadar_006917 [Vaccinium darrowii]